MKEPKDKLKLKLKLQLNMNKIIKYMVLPLNIILIIIYLYHILFDLRIIWNLFEGTFLYFLLYFSLGYVGFELQIFNIIYFVSKVYKNNNYFTVIYLNFVVTIFWLVLFFVSE